MVEMPHHRDAVPVLNVLEAMATASTIRRKALRLVIRPALRLRRLLQRLRGQKQFGAHAVPLTHRGKVVLVKLRYASGWHFPGGGLKIGEDPQSGALRELREEIGLEAHGDVLQLFIVPPARNPEEDLGSVFLVRDVEYRPRRSFEVECVREFDLDDLPCDLSQPARQWLNDLRPRFRRP